MELKKKIVETIQSLYSDEGLEKGGYVTEDGRVVVCDNDSPNPLENFSFKIEDLMIINDEEDIIALFHTHPNGTSAMTKQDFKAFVNYPNFYHLILGKNGLLCYKVTERETVIIEDLAIDES